MQLASTSAGADDGSAPKAMEAALEHHQAGRLPQAEALYRQALRWVPNHADALHHLGVIAYQMGQSESAVELIGRAISAKPSNPLYYSNLGLAFQNQGRLNEAVASYQKALSFKPDYAEAYYNLGNALLHQGKVDEAVASYRQALSFSPDYAEAHNNLGVALLQQGQLDEAVASHRRALSFRPDHAEAYCNLGMALNVQGKVEDAVASYRQALSFKPDHAEAHYNLGNALLRQGKLDEAVSSYRRALSIKPDYVEAHSNLLFAIYFYPFESPAKLMAECERFAAQFEAPLRARWQRHRNLREPQRRLKVGYVSGDFRRHAVAYFIEPVLANHDKDRVEVCCYYNHSQHDEFTDRLAGYADRWLDCQRMTDEQLAERIRVDGIDILVDLAGHTAHNRMLTFARKPAPVQITYLGSPGASSGLAGMDYRLTDAHADPEGSEAFYTERLLRLPGSLWCYRPARDMPEILALPAQENGYVTFGSFNNFSKIDARCIELWAQLLRTVPDSRILMVAVPEGESRQRLTEQFAALGVQAKRLEFHGRLSSTEFHRMLQRADIALDPFPVRGGTTTCETLWMGLPVISLVGTRAISRLGLSVLNTIGLQDLAAATPEEYVSIAVNLAANLPRLAELHAGLRARMAGSPLMDGAKFTQSLERVYREIWTEWCHSEA